MAFTLESIVPWGRSFEEYREMFALSDRDLSCRLLGCGDGPASFNAEASRRGCSVLSIDPIYAYSADKIRRRVDETFPRVLEQTRANAGNFNWEAISSVEELGAIRRQAMDAFLADFPAGRAAGRYLPGELPRLPLADSSFDLALSSHLLFLYGDRLSCAFHLAALRDLARVAGEVRVFPLLELDNRPSRHLPGVLKGLEQEGYRSEIVVVPYHFQRGGDQMLRVLAPRLAGNRMKP